MPTLEGYWKDEINHTWETNSLSRQLTTIPPSDPSFPFLKLSILGKL
jgi:hypothetical protein